MSWVRLDDAFPDSRKFLRIGPLAGYLHIAAIAWSNRNLTDGVIPREQPPRLAAWHVVNDQLASEVVGKIPGHQDAVAWPKLVDLLLANQLWHEREDGDYEIHDYLEYQKSAAEIRVDRDSLRTKRAEAGRLGAKSRWKGDKDGNPDGKPDGKAVANAQQTNSKPDGKAVANAMAKPWQTDGPNPNPLTTPPNPPKGERGRDRDRYEKELRTYAAQLLPEEHGHTAFEAVKAALDMLRGRGVELVPEIIRGEARYWIGRETSLPDDQRARLKELGERAATINANAKDPA